MKPTPRFFITPEPFGNGHSVKFGAYDEQSETLTAALPIQLKTYPKGEFPTEPMFVTGWIGGDSALQSLMDELWREGFRPKDIGTAGHLAATQQHLADFRAIVAKQLGVEFK